MMIASLKVFTTEHNLTPPNRVEFTQFVFSARFFFTFYQKLILLEQHNVTPLW